MTKEVALETLIDNAENGYVDIEEVKLVFSELEQKPCEDAISRQAVLDGIDAKAWEFCDYLISKGRNDEQKPVSHFADNLREFVSEELPSVKPQEPKTGHWITIPGMNEKCSQCGEYFPLSDFKNRPFKIYFCPQCGSHNGENDSEVKE